MEPERRSAFAAYSVVMGLAAYAGLAFFVISRVDALAGRWPDLAAFTILAALSWRFSFSIFPKTSISLDMAYVLTALLVLPSPSAAVIGAGTAILGSFLRSREEATLLGSLDGVLNIRPPALKVIFIRNLITMHVTYFPRFMICVCHHCLLISPTRPMTYPVVTSTYGEPKSSFACGRVYILILLDTLALEHLHPTVRPVMTLNLRVLPHFLHSLV